MICKKQKGQFVVEFVLGFGIWVTVFSGIIFLSRLLILRQRIHQVARLGTLLQSTGRLSNEAIESELRNYSDHISLTGTTPWTFEMGRFLETPASRFYRLVQTRVTAPLGHAGRSVSEVVVCQQEEGAL